MKRPFFIAKVKEGKPSIDDKLVVGVGMAAVAEVEMFVIYSNVKWWTLL